MRQTQNLYQVYELSGSALQLGLTGLAQGIPIFALGLFAGTLADFLDRRKLLLITIFGNCLGRGCAGRINAQRRHSGLAYSRWHRADFRTEHRAQSHTYVANLTPRAALASHQRRVTEFERFAEFVLFWPHGSRPDSRWSEHRQCLFGQRPFLCSSGDRDPAAQSASHSRGSARKFFPRKHSRRCKISFFGAHRVGHGAVGLYHCRSWLLPPAAAYFCEGYSSRRPHRLRHALVRASRWRSSRYAHDSFFRRHRAQRTTRPVVISFLCFDRGYFRHEHADGIVARSSRSIGSGEFAAGGNAPDQLSSVDPRPVRGRAFAVFNMFSQGANSVGAAEIGFAASLLGAPGALVWRRHQRSSDAWLLDNIAGSTRFWNRDAAPFRIAPHHAGFTLLRGCTQTGCDQHVGEPIICTARR